MRMSQLIALSELIPIGASELSLYPTNRTTLFFSLTEGVQPHKGAAWSAARDAHPGKGLSRWKVCLPKEEVTEQPITEDSSMGIENAE